MTLSFEFVSGWSIRVAVWSVTLVGLVVICSKECGTQNSKYDLVRWGINGIYGFVCENLFILRLQSYTDVTKKITFLGFKDVSVAECAF